MSELDPTRKPEVVTVVQSAELLGRSVVKLKVMQGVVVPGGSTHPLAIFEVAAHPDEALRYQVTLPWAIDDPDDVAEFDLTEAVAAMRLAVEPVVEAMRARVTEPAEDTDG
jgi:hypothetical protein